MDKISMIGSDPGKRSFQLRGGHEDGSSPNSSGFEPSSRSVALRAPVLGVGNCKTAWLLVQKIRWAMELADGFPLAFSVQADETTLPNRAQNSDPPHIGGRSEGVLMIVGTVAVSEGGRPGQVKLPKIKDYPNPVLKAFVEYAAVQGT